MKWLKLELTDKQIEEGQLSAITNLLGALYVVGSPLQSQAAIYSSKTPETQGSQVFYISPRFAPILKLRFNRYDLSYTYGIPPESEALNLIFGHDVLSR